MTATGTPTQPHPDPLASFPNGAVTSRDANLLCGELEASPVSPPNWAGLARALYTSNYVRKNQGYENEDRAQVGNVQAE